MKNNITYRMAAVVAVCAGMALGACSSDDDILSSSAAGGASRVELSFTATDTDWGGNTQTRSAGDGPVAVYKSEGDGEPLYLSLSVSDGIDTGDKGVATRGRPIANGTFWENFRVFGYMYSGTFGSSNTPDFMYHEQVTKDATTDRYETAAQYYLPGGGNKVRFFAYTVTNYANVGDMNSASRFRYPTQSTGGAPRFYYRVPANVLNQPDVCFASGAEAEESTGKVKFNFIHALAAISFQADETLAGKIISNIEIRGMKTSGYFTCADLQSPIANGIWEYDARYEDKQNASITDQTGYNGAGSLYFWSTDEDGSSFSPVTVGDSGITDISGESRVFLTLPHPDLTKGVDTNDDDKGDAESAVHVIVTIDDDTKNFYFSSGSWEMGKTYTYTLTAK